MDRPARPDDGGGFIDRTETPFGKSVSAPVECHAADPEDAVEGVLDRRDGWSVSWKEAGEGLDWPRFKNSNLKVSGAVVRLVSQIVV